MISSASLVLTRLSLQDKGIILPTQWNNSWHKKQRTSFTKKAIKWDSAAITAHNQSLDSTYSHDCEPQDESNAETKRRKKSELQRLRRDEQPESLRMLQNDANRVRIQQVRGVEKLTAYIR
jgi:hypothetical protein